METNHKTNYHLLWSARTKHIHLVDISDLSESEIKNGISDWIILDPYLKYDLYVKISKIFNIYSYFDLNKRTYELEEIKFLYSVFKIAYEGETNV